jgi:hypothetical protein
VALIAFGNPFTDLFGTILLQGLEDIELIRILSCFSCEAIFWLPVGANAYLLDEPFLNKLIKRSISQRNILRSFCPFFTLYL